MRKIGIFGGTFDPIHWGHLLIAESALCHVNLEQVIWVPNPCPHYRQATLFEHRLEMVQKAITDNPAFTLSSSTIALVVPAYAIQTLTQLQSVYPNTYWYWILGLDTFETLPLWYRIQELATACKWLIAPRAVSSVQKAEQAIAEIQFRCEHTVQQLASKSINLHWQILSTPLVGISASLIRQRCRDRRSIRYLVPESVRSYIATHNLYYD